MRVIRHGRQFVLTPDADRATIGRAVRPPLSAATTLPSQWVVGDGVHRTKPTHVGAARIEFTHGGRGRQWQTTWR